MGLWHCFCLLSWLIAINFLVDMVMKLGSLMWLFGGIATIVLANERKSVIRRTQQFITGYSLGLLGYRIILSFITTIPIADWSRQMGVQLPASFSSTISNWIMMIFTFTMILVPVTYATWLGKTFWTFKSRREVRQRTKEVMRTGKQRER